MLGVTVFVELALLDLLLEVLVLEAGGGDIDEDDEAEVQVEPVRDVVKLAVLEFFGQLKLIREAAGVEGDSADEEVGPGERCSQDNGVEVEDECSDGANNSSGNGEDPEKHITLGSPEGCGVEQDAE